MTKDIKVAIIGLSGESIFLEVDEFHKPGETIIAKSVHVEPGGKGYNQAACLLKLGASVAYLSTIGEDENAKNCYDYLNQARAKLYFKEISEEKTAIATILTNSRGDNQVTVYHGASKMLEMKHLDEFKDEIRSSDFLLLTLELPLEIVEEAIRVAKSSGITVILNPAPHNPKFKLYDLCDIIIPNEIEAKQIFNLDINDDIIESANELSKSHLFDKIKAMIITLGADGCLLISNGEVNKINGIKVNTVDTTGAGDVFNASFTYFYGQGYDINKAIEYANISAALSTTKKYVLNSLPELQEIIKIKKI